MWTTSLDLSDAYFHIPIAPCHRHFLRFAWMGKVYAFKALPFGLAIAPLVFTKIMQAPLGHLHSRGIKVHAYLDDFLVKAGTYQEVSLHTTCVRDTLLSLGFLISWGKVRSDSVSGFHFPRGTFPYPEGNCPTPRGEVQYPVSENICFSDQRSTSCSTFSTTVGVSEFNSGNRPIGTTPHQTPSVVSQGILGSSVPTLGCYDSHSSLVYTLICFGGLREITCYRVFLSSHLHLP